MLSGLAARLGAGYFALFVFVGLTGPYLGLWLDQLGHDATTIGLLLALLAATKVGASTLWAWLGDHTGRRVRLVRSAAALAAVASIGLVLARDAWAVALVLFVCASFWNALAPQLEVLTLHGVGSSRYSRVRVWGSVGFIGAVLGGGVLFERAGLAAFPWAVLAALAALALVALAIPEEAADAGGPTAAAQAPARLLDALRAPGVVPLFGAFVLMQVGFGAYYGFFSLYLAGLGHTGTAIGALWALGVVAEIAAFALMPALTARASLTALLGASCALTALRWLILAGLAGSMGWLVVAQLLHAASFGVYHSVAVQLVARAFPGRLAGRGQALHSSLAYGVGGAVGAALAGVLWDGIAPSAAFFGAAAVSTGAWLCLAAAPRIEHGNLEGEGTSR
jgi:PPP family 3-phenylpropionic acid transporter